MRVIWAPRALADIENLYLYIADHDPAAAARMAERLFQAAELLGRFPLMGRQVSDRRREWTVVPPYVIRYSVSKTQTRVLRVFHGHQQR